VQQLFTGVINATNNFPVTPCAENLTFYLKKRSQ